MTDRLKGVWVAFEKDIRVDDADPIINAIQMIKGVEAVKPNISNPDDWINRQQIKSSIQVKLWDALNSDK